MEIMVKYRSNQEYIIAILWDFQSQVNNLSDQNLTGQSLICKLIQSQNNQVKLQQQLVKNMFDCFIDQQSFDFINAPGLQEPENDIQLLEITQAIPNQVSHQLSLSAKKQNTTIKDVIANVSSRRISNKTKHKLNRKISKSSKAKKIASYKKNICGYITKKVLREFICNHYRKKIQQICYAQGADYETTKNYYEARIEGITGPSHIPLLLSSRNKQEIPTVRVFLIFFKWFLMERYVRHLFSEGKMEMKSIYIQYKNKQLIPLINTYQKILNEESQNSSTLFHGDFGIIC